MTLFLPKNHFTLISKYISFSSNTFLSYKFSTSFLLYLVILFSGITNASAATITSVQSGGNWNSTDTWVGGVIPTSTSDVIINGDWGNSITLQSNITIASLTLTDNGGINAGNNNITITGNLKIGNFSTGNGLYRDNGSVSVGGNFEYNNAWNGTGQLGGGTQAGYFSMNGTSFSITNNNQPFSIPKFRVGNAALTITKNGTGSFTVSTEYDRNCLPAPIIQGVFSVTGSTIGNTCQPTITLSKNILPGFSYGAGSGPSSEQSYAVSGANLTGNITITAPADYKITTTSGSGYVSSLTLTKSGGIVNSTIIFVRLNAGLPVNTTNSQPILHSSTNATTTSVICSGTVNCTSPPTVISPVIYCLNAIATPLTSTGTTLKWVDFGSGSIGGLNAGNDKQYTEYQWSNWALQFTTNFDNVTIKSVDVYSSNVNTSTECSIGIYNNAGTLLTTSPVSMPASNSNIKYTIPFNYQIGSAGNYSIRLVTGSGSFGNISLISTTSANVNITGNYDYARNQSTTINIYNNLQYIYNNQSSTPPTPGTSKAGTSTYYVTQKVGPCTSGTATIEVIVNANCPVITTSVTALTGFSTYGKGTSMEQHFTVAGTYLISDLSLTPPADYEISLATGASFLATNPIKLSPASGSVVATTIYVRLKAGLTVGNYASKNIIISTTGVVSTNVDCTGKALPTLPDLAAASGFIFFTDIGAMSNNGASTITGNVGNNSGAVTGFENATITGSIHFADDATQQAAIDLNAANSYINTLTGSVISETLGNKTLTPGIYQTTKGSSINGTLVLDALGDPNAYFIIRIGGALTTGTGSIITLKNSASINHVFWQVNGAFKTGTSSKFTGNTIVNGAISLLTGSNLQGNALSTNGAIVINNSVASNTGLPDRYLIIENNQISSPQTIRSGITPVPLTGTLPTGGNEAYVYLWESSLTSATAGFTSTGGVSRNYSPGALTQTTWFRRKVTSGKYNNTSTAIQIIVLPVLPVIIPPELGAAAGFAIFTTTGAITNKGNSIITGDIGNNDKAAITGFPPGILKGSIQSGNEYTLQASTDLTIANNYITSLAGTVLGVTLGNGTRITPGVYDTGAAATINGELILDAQGDPTAVFIIKIGGALSTVTHSTITLANSANIKNIFWQVQAAFILESYSVFKGIVIANGAISIMESASLNGCALTTAGAIIINNNLISNSNLINRFIVDGNLGNSANWNNNIVPSSTDNIIISSVATIDGDYTYKNLIIDTKGTVAIPPEKSLTITGILSNYAGSQGLIIKADPLLSNGSLIIPNAKKVQATVEMYSKASWNLSKDIPEGSRYNWQFFGIPVSSLKANPAFYGAYVRRWNEKGNNSTYWLQLNNDSVLLKFAGYEITQSGPKIYEFTGELVNEDFPGNLSYTNGALHAGQNIFCNPYTAAIDISKITFGNNTENSIYFYNTGSYHDWISTNSPLGDGAGQYNVSPTQLSGTGEIPGQIPSMQGFLVKATGIGGSITIPYSAVVKNTGKLRIPSEIHTGSSDKVYTMLDIKGSRFSDRMWIFSDPLCTTLFDNGWDGYKLKGSLLTPQLYVAGIDGDYQVNAVKDMNNTLLGFQAGEDTEYTLTVTNGNTLTQYSGIFLVDLLENKTIDITTTGTTYSFKCLPTPNAVNRFKIVTIPAMNDDQPIGSTVKVFNSGSTVFVQNLSTSNGELIIYDMMGRYLKKETFGPSAITSVQLKNIPGGYVVKASSGNERISKRIMLGK